MTTINNRELSRVRDLIRNREAKKAIDQSLPITQKDGLHLQDVLDELIDRYNGAADAAVRRLAVRDNEGMEPVDVCFVGTFEPEVIDLYRLSSSYYFGHGTSVYFGLDKNIYVERPNRYGGTQWRAIDWREYYKATAKRGQEPRQSSIWVFSDLHAAIMDLNRIHSDVDIELEEMAHSKDGVLKELINQFEGAVDAAVQRIVAYRYKGVQLKDVCFFGNPDSEEVPVYRIDLQGPIVGPDTAYLGLDGKIYVQSAKPNPYSGVNLWYTIDWLKYYKDRKLPARGAMRSSKYAFSGLHAAIQAVDAINPGAVPE